MALQLHRTHFKVFIKKSMGIHWLKVVVSLPLWEAGLGFLSMLFPQSPPSPPVLDQPSKTTREQSKFGETTDSDSEQI